MKLIELGKLRVGDAFKFPEKENIFIAFSLTPDPFEVFCLDVKTREIKEFEESEKVILITGYELVPKKCVKRGQELEVL